MQQAQVCPLCHGELREDVIRHAVTHGHRIIVFTNVPARVCGQCGEPYFAGIVVDEMNQFAWSLGEDGAVMRGDLSVHVHRLGTPATAA